MKLVCLNIWGGTVYSLVTEFLKAQSRDTDIFCFQEVFNAPESVSQQEASGARVHLFSEIQNILPNHQGFFLPYSFGHDYLNAVDFPLEIGLACFVKKSLKILAHSSEIVYEEGVRINNLNQDFLPKIIQAVKLDIGGKKVNVLNFHGLTFPGDKLDTPKRLKQSANIVNVLKSLEGSKILCGDFNLELHTQSISILEEGMVNLIKKFNIQNTRNELSWKKFTGEKQYFSDYVFVSSDVKVKNFEVPYNEVSDHLPMLVEFDI